MKSNRGRVQRREQWVPTAEFARRLRAAPTRSEKFLWRFLRRRQRLGLRFRRQHPVHRWVVDFYCAAAKVAVEVDGAYHEGRRDADLLRDRALDRLGIMVLRLPNEVVLGNIDSALGQIDWALSRRRRRRSRSGEARRPNGGRRAARFPTKERLTSEDVPACAGDHPTTDQAASTRA